MRKKSNTAYRMMFQQEQKKIKNKPLRLVNTSESKSMDEYRKKCSQKEKNLITIRQTCLSCHAVRDKGCDIISACYDMTSIRRSFLSSMSVLVSFILFFALDIYIHK